MSVDLRTEINDCEDNTVTFSTSGSGLGDDALAGQFYEGTQAVKAQHSNNDDELYTTTNSAGTALNINMSDVTAYVLLKDSLPQTFANRGVQILLDDGTDRIGYSVGGSNAQGISVGPFFNVYKLDVSEIVAAPGTNFAVYAGSEANLDQTAITGFGIGTFHNAKAQGNVANLALDRMTYHANGSYGLRINGGTVGTPETMADVQGDDVTAGWGLVSNPLGSQFSFFAPTEWGEPTANADVYFTATDEQWFWVGDNAGGRAVGATHFPMRIVGNATDTIDITWTNLVIVNTGTRAEFTVGDANVDAIDWDNVTLDGVGAITFPAQDVNKTHDVVTFNNCDQVAPNGCNGTDWTFNGAFNADGAMLLDTAGDSNNLVNVIFNSDGTGHAIIITATGTYDFDNFTFSAGYTGTGTDAAVYNNSGGAVTINVQNGGDTPSVRNGAGASTTINNAVTVRVDGVAEGTAISVLANETVGTITAGDVILQGLADSTGALEDTGFNYEAAFNPSGLDTLITARNQGLPTAAIADDGGVQTDETTAANSGTTDDMTLTPTTPATGDAYYWGHPEEPAGLKINVSSASTDTGQTITWEYWNGAWTALSAVTDGTNSFQNSGLNKVTWTQPTDWATSTENSQGPYYYLRARVSAVGGTPNQALGRWSSLDVTRYLPIPPQGVLQRTITSSGLTATLTQAVDTISTF